MRVKLLKRPPKADIADLSSENFDVGRVYDLNTLLAFVFLAEGWGAAPSDDDPQPALVPAVDVLPFGGVVLVVDDEPGVRHLARILLSHDGYDVVVARNGKEALGRLTDRCPDLVVLDLHMPVMNGWQFRSEQRQLPPHLASIPVLLMTSEADADACAVALEAAAVLKKPFAAHALLEAVRTTLREHRATAEPSRHARTHSRLIKSETIVLKLPDTYA